MCENWHNIYIWAAKLNTGRKQEQHQHQLAPLVRSSKTERRFNRENDAGGRGMEVYQSHELGPAAGAGRRRVEKSRRQGEK